MPGLATLRVACLYTHPMQTRGLARIAASCREGLLTDSVLELVDWKPDVIVVADQSQLPQLRAYAERVGAYLVGLRHGAANKYIGPDPEFSLADYVCGSEWDVEDFRSHNVWPRRDILLTGNPWMDDLFRVPLRRPNTEAPTLLLAPTYNPETSAAALFGDRFVPLVRSVFPASRIVIKPHPLVTGPDHRWLRESGLSPVFRNWRASWRKAARDPAVTVVSDPTVSIARCFSEADILVSDGSSLVFEFMALERPILLYSSGRRVGFWSGRWDERAPGNAWRDIGIEFSTSDEFVEALRLVQGRHATEHRSRQRAHAEALYGRFRDGRCAERAAAALESLPRLSASPDVHEAVGAGQPWTVALTQNGYERSPDRRYADGVLLAGAEAPGPGWQRFALLEVAVGRERAGRAVPVRVGGGAVSQGAASIPARSTTGVVYTVAAVGPTPVRLVVESGSGGRRTGTRSVVVNHCRPVPWTELVDPAHRFSLSLWERVCRREALEASWRWSTARLDDPAGTSVANPIAPSRLFRPAAWPIADPPAPGASGSPTVEHRLTHLVPWLAWRARSETARRVAIFGAGRHTQILLPLWQAFGGPPVDSVVSRSAQMDETVCGIPVIRPDELGARGVDAVVLSSASFEAELETESRQRWPGLRCYPVWHHLAPPGGADTGDRRAWLARAIVPWVVRQASVEGVREVVIAGSPVVARQVAAIWRAWNGPPVVGGVALSDTDCRFPPGIQATTLNRVRPGSGAAIVLAAWEREAELDRELRLQHPHARVFRVWDGLGLWGERVDW